MALDLETMGPFYDRPHKNHEHSSLLVVT